ncbi:metal ABC transporter solute-binding protein, Zn/Mn family [Prochlorococcus marinus]|jgi:zinc/manganese transport system substrate-binding protein|uniref:ABC transporter, substrate binding protein, possibly Mn n=1 Tax=Prochlorococcus marinus (strain MIT 9301) TaxID=167546 RepID=A3PDD2_PROM0|nr:zinc ABC transporter substrate-binding protein [Prochlorococcus marinus]ABO17757.1 ABC transporter, substrate binding protein, possibly Mn [Prochlorococcus marinus str. MIT 9301]
MSIFKRLLTNKKGASKSIIKNSVIAGTIIFSGFGQDVMAKGKSYVAVEPLVCDLVKSIALPSDEVTCLVDRKQDVHDLKINPRQAKLLNSADKVFTLGREMTPSMRNWENKKNTVVVGVSAIDVDDHSDHGGHDDHSDHGGHDDHSKHSAKVDDHSDHGGHDDHSDHGGHDDHAEGAFEWAGKFQLSKGSYKWSFEKVDGEYADPAMKMVILKSNDIEGSEDLAKELLGSKDSISRKNDGTLIASNKAFVLNFDQKKESTVFNVDIKEDGQYIFFTEHMPFEFEATQHFFKDVSNSDVEPIAQVPDEGEGHHHHDHGGLDPHVWHDPHNIIKMGDLISKSLKKDISVFNRGDRKLINERFEKADSLLEDLDSWIVEQVSSIPEENRVIVSKHKAMEYYGDAFGFETISLLDFLGDSSSLRPDNISSTLKMLDEEKVQAIFPEQIPASKLLRNLSRQSSVPLASNQIFVDGLMMDGNTVSVAVHNTCTIVDSLGGSCDKESGSNLESEWYKLSD